MKITGQIHVVNLYVVDESAGVVGTQNRVDAHLHVDSIYVEVSFYMKDNYGTYELLRDAFNDGRCLYVVELNESL